MLTLITYSYPQSKQRNSYHSIQVDYERIGFFCCIAKLLTISSRLSITFFLAIQCIKSSTKPDPKVYHAYSSIFPFICQTIALFVAMRSKRITYLSFLRPFQQNHPSRYLFSDLKPGEEATLLPIKSKKQALMISKPEQQH